MNNQTFGQFLKRVLEKREISTRALAAMMGLKSKTQVIRLLEDSCTIKTIEAFSEKLKTILDLSKKEIADMDEVILNHGTSQALLKSRSVLKMILTGECTDHSKRISCFLKNGCDDIKKQCFLSDALFETVCGKEKSFEVYIRNINSIELITALNRIIHSENPPKITVHHFFCDGDGVEDIGVQLCSLLNLATFANYCPYRLPEGVNMGSGMVIFENGGEMTTLINVFGGKYFSQITEKFPPDMYKHIVKSYERLIAISTPLKHSFKNDPLEKLSDYIEDLRVKDTSPYIELSSGLCFMMIPFHIQERLYRDSNFIGLGENHPIAKKMYMAMKERSEALFSKKSKSAVHICTKEGILRFIQTGKTDEWLPFFRELTPAERAETILYVRQNFAGNMHLLSGKFEISDFECVVFQNHGIEICAPKNGYWSNFSIVSINDRKMERLLRDFLLNDVVENCCITKRNMKKVWLEIDRRMNMIAYKM